LRSRLRWSLWHRRSLERKDVGDISPQYSRRAYLRNTVATGLAIVASRKSWRSRRTHSSTKSPKPEHPHVEGKRGQHDAHNHQPRWHRQPALLLLILIGLLVHFPLLSFFLFMLTMLFSMVHGCPAVALVLMAFALLSCSTGRGAFKTFHSLRQSGNLLHDSALRKDSVAAIVSLIEWLLRVSR
jgi:hypothetical protein